MTSVLFAIFFLLAFMNVPIAFSLFIASAVTLHLTDVPVFITIQRATTAIDSFILLAIPFFIFAGNIMGASDISKKITDFCSSIVGSVTGALAHVNIIASMVFAGITGAAVADTSAIGGLLIPAMKEEGYPGDFSAAVTASSSVIGVIIPPSIPFVMYSVITGVSVGKMFMAGIIPGILVGLSQILISYVICKKHNYGYRKPFSFPTMAKTFHQGFFALFMPAVIIGGILFGIVTPTEAAIMATLYAAVLGFFIYKTINIKMVPAILMETIKTTSVVMFMISAANLYGWLITRAQIPRLIVHTVVAFTDNPYVVIALFILVYVITGMFLDMGAAIILLVPVLYPVVQQFNIDPIVFGIITTITLGMGLVTPPVGACLFIACHISGEGLFKVGKAAIPFFVAFLLLDLMIVFIPDIVLFIPGIMIPN